MCICSRSSGKFFIPVEVLRDKFKGKYMALLSSLYEKDWCPYIKETVGGFGNAIEYLGRYTHRIAISNSRILSVTQDEAAFTARGKKPGESKRLVTLKNTESPSHL